jgi:hypothetical protein
MPIQPLGITHRYTQVFWILGAFPKVQRILEINGYYLMEPRRGA